MQIKRVGNTVYVVVKLSSSLSRMAEFTSFKLLKGRITALNGGAGKTITLNEKTVINENYIGGVFETREEAEEYMFKSNNNKYMYFDLTIR